MSTNMETSDNPALDDLTQSDWLWCLRSVSDRDGDRADDRWDPERLPSSGFGTSPDRVAYELLREAMACGPHGFYRIRTYRSGEALCDVLHKRLEEARLIDAKLAHLADPAFINHAALERRRTQGEESPKPRIHLHARRTVSGNLIVEAIPRADDDPSGADLLDRPDWATPSHSRPWKEILFLRKLEDFEGQGPNPPRSWRGFGWKDIAGAMLGVFAVRAFQYAVHRAREEFEVTFGDVLCLRVDEEGAPYLSLVPYPELADARRAEAEAELERHEV